MDPHPTGRYGLLRIPAPTATAFAMRFAPLTDRDKFYPANWTARNLVPSPANLGWWEIDIDALGLADGVYEYEFLLNGTAQQPIADPYADEITRFGGYRGLFSISGGTRIRRAFRWDDEFRADKPLRQNNEIVIYEMPLKWMASASDNSLVEVGTFDKVIYEHLDYLETLGVNCIELLPIEDTSQTLNWGYGTRFFFAPDYDMGNPVDAKFFIKCCHRRGIRVILDVVMNFYNPTCPLAALADGWFHEASSPDRNDWGQCLFHFNMPAYDNYFAAREFLCEMAEFWVSEFHIDGYRIDDFADINNWDFVQAFRDRATAANQALLPTKPFLVIAEDSNRRFQTTASLPSNPNGRKVVDAIWNFGYRDEIRRLATNAIDTNYGQPARSVRVQHLVSKDGVWNAYGAGSLDPGYADMACAIDYATSHDVADGPRMMNVILGSILQTYGLGDGSVQNIRSLFPLDGPPLQDGRLRGAVNFALYRVFGVFAVLMTSVGIPMLLAGEEFGDVHDGDYNDVNAKQQDPVQWGRAALSGNAALLANVSQLVRLRTTHPALQRNEVEFFYFHPQFDGNDGCRVFAYCRTGGIALGSRGQVIVIANMGPQKFTTYDFPNWPWGGAPLTEIGYLNGTPIYDATRNTLSLGIDAFQVRVFTC
jgi:1,4-alpha-glucan branching enzyme